MSERQAWRQQPISIEQWKANCRASIHVRDSEALSFNERDGVVSCCIEGVSIFLGDYFPAGKKVSCGMSILPGTGWNH